MSAPKFSFLLQPESEEFAFAENLSLSIGSFTGALDLFLTLLDNQELRLEELPLLELIHQYQEKVSELRPNLSVQSAFLLLAAVLLEMKTRLLLPKVEEEVPEEEGPEWSAEHADMYARYKKSADLLRARKEEFEKVVLRREVLPAEAFPNAPLQLSDEVSLSDLVDAFKELVREVESRENPVQLEEVGHLFTVAEKVQKIEQAVGEKRDGVPLRALLEVGSRIEVIVTFVAILELAKGRRILLRQSEKFGEIWVYGR